MKKRKSVSQSGYSLVELLIVLTVTGVLATFAVVRFVNAGTGFKRQNIARELKINLERARFDSVKRRAENNARAEVTLLSATSFTIKSDLNQNGTLDATDFRTVDFGGQNTIKIVGNALVFPVTIKFDRHGRIEARDGTKDAGGAPAPKEIAPIFTVCTDGCTSANAKPGNSDVIYVSPSGTVAMLKGGASSPVFAAPSVSPISVTAQINKNIQVNSAAPAY